MDWTDACDALARLELAHLVERQQVAQVLEELTADPLLFLSVEISAETLSADPQRQPIAWAELLGRLRHDRYLARRLIVDIRENTDGCLHLPQLSRTRSLASELRKLGVPIASGKWHRIEWLVARVFTWSSWAMPIGSHHHAWIETERE